MKIVEIPFKGCYIIVPDIFKDHRGFFCESYNEGKYLKSGVYSEHFVQDNISFSSYGVIRGLHFQKEPFQQAKLVSVIQGKILDVVVDLRKDSATFGQHLSYELSDENNVQIFVPKGFAHGFVVLSETAKVFYKCDNYYNKGAEGGIRFDDPVLKIDWQIPKEDMLLSEKDEVLPLFSFEDTYF